MKKKKTTPQNVVPVVKMFTVVVNEVLVVL